jgi:kynurenine formamidase
VPAESTGPGRLPAYADLPAVKGAPPHSAWGLWGAEDQLGTLNLLTAERIAAAARLVRKGAVFALNWELELPDPVIARGRRDLPRHTYVVYGSTTVEDVLDNFYPQSSSQWDAFSHAGHPQHGFYNGASIADVTHAEHPRNGIEHWARRGIAGRGVLLDFGRFVEESGREFDYTTATPITVADLEEVRRAQQVEMQDGDILLVRTGWMRFYLAQRRSWKYKIGRDPRVPGLESSREMVAYLWDHHIAALAADNYSVEAHAGADVSLHKDLTALCGVPLGEFWYLETLSEDCASDGVYEFLLTSAPLNKRGGAGSPPNALAIK